MKKINILHLSDLHYDSSSSKDINIVLDALWKDLEIIKKEYGIIIHFIVFSGDIVKIGDNISDFNDAKKYFIDNLISTLNLSYDEFFFSPGNHDIQISKIDPYIESGLVNKLIDRDEVNSLIDSIEYHSNVFDRLSNFNSFKEQIKSKYAIESNILYSTYIFPIYNLNIGIACINSSWRATGAPDDLDHGKLIIGERQIDNAFNDIKFSDIKICIIHHPFECLNPFEFKNTQRRVFSNFNMIFFGHHHEPEPALIANPSTNVLVCTAGCIYQNRKYYNGYNIVSYDLDSNKIISYFRRYSDILREFHKDLEYIPNGEQVFNFKHNKLYEPVIPINAVDLLSNALIEQANQKLLSANPASFAPKNLRDIFVEPILLEKPKEKIEAYAIFKKSQPEDTKRYELKELISSESSFLIIGKKESGKTTLLNFLCLSFLENEFSPNFKLPFYINWNNLPSGKPIDVFKKAMLLNVYNSGLYREFNIDKILEDGNCILLFDDFSFRNFKNIDKLNQFIEKYPKVRFLFSINEELDFMLDLDLKIRDKLHLKLQKIYLQPFNRKQIRQLVQNWFKTVSVNTDNILENIIENIYKLNVPKSPAIISLLLWIFEKQENYIATNKALLLEKIFDIVLEKLQFTQIQVFKLDFRDKEDYLSYIAFLMAKKNKYFFENRTELEKETISYFSEIRGLTISITPFINYFFERGVFLELPNKQIIFKYACFCEYFIAKRMIKDVSFYNEIIKIDNYLDFINEIDYLTGLQGNNSEILHIMESRIDNLFKRPDIIFDLSSFENINISIGLLNYKDSRKLIKYAKQFDDIRRDELLDTTISLEDLRKMEFIRYLRNYSNDEIIQFVNITYPELHQHIKENDSIIRLQEMSDDQICNWLDSMIREPDIEQCIRKRYLSDIYRQPIIIYMMNLILFSRLIKNGELIYDLDFRKKILRKCLINWGKIILYIMQEVEKNIKLTTELSEEEKKIYVNIFTLTIIQMLISNELGSDKLETLLDSGIDDNGDNKLLTLLYTFIYSDMRLKNYLRRIRDLSILCRNNNYILEVILYKLLMYYYLRKLTNKEQNDIENLIADINITRILKKKKRPDISKAKSLTIKKIRMDRQKKFDFLIE